MNVVQVYILANRRQFPKSIKFQNNTYTQLDIYVNNRAAISSFALFSAILSGRMPSASLA